MKNCVSYDIICLEDERRRTDLTGGVSMAFLASFIQTAIKFILMAAVAGCGLFFGKKLRDRKDAKTAAEELTAKEK